METFTIRLADINIGINCIHQDTMRMCQDYLTNEAPEVTIETSFEDISFEREKSDRERELEGHLPQSYSDGYLETLAVYRRIAENLLKYNILLFHGSVVSVDSEGYLFTARSGMGKSTHTRLWREKFGDRAVMVNDDKPLLKITENGIIAYGTPWDGKHHLSANVSVPLKSICILKRDKVNHIRQIDKKEAYSMLVQQAYRPGQALEMTRVLNLLDNISDKVPLYELFCNMDPEAAAVSYEGMCRKKKS